MKSRREFLMLVAAGSAAALTTQARGAAAAVKHAAKTAAHPDAEKTKAKTPGAAKPGSSSIPSAIAIEIEKQKKSTADALKVIRDYPLPAGSPMAFTFAPMRATRRVGR